MKLKITRARVFSEPHPLAAVFMYAWMLHEKNVFVKHAIPSRAILNYYLFSEEGQGHIYIGLTVKVFPEGKQMQNTKVGQSQGHI